MKKTFIYIYITSHNLHFVVYKDIYIYFIPIRITMYEYLRYNMIKSHSDVCNFFLLTNIILVYNSDITGSKRGGFEKRPTIINPSVSRNDDAYCHNSISPFSETSTALIVPCTYTSS